MQALARGRVSLRLIDGGGKATVRDEEESSVENAAHLARPQRLGKVWTSGPALPPCLPPCLPRDARPGTVQAADRELRCRSAAGDPPPDPGRCFSS